MAAPGQNIFAHNGPDKSTCNPTAKAIPATSHANCGKTDLASKRAAPTAAAKTVNVEAAVKPSHAIGC